MDVLRRTKQDKIATVKNGLFSSGDGQGGDMGICLNNGKLYFSVKTKGQWYFAELKSSKDI